MSDFIRVFRNPAEYEAYLESECQAQLQRNAQAAIARIEKAAVRRQHARQRSRFDSVPFEEKERLVNRILAREDVKDLKEHAARFARTVRVFSGGIPSLGRR